VKVGFHNFYSIYHSNRMFEDPSSPIGDNLMYPFVYLKEYFRSKGHHVCTIDMAPLEHYDAVVFLEYPGATNKYYQELRSRYPKTPLYLVLVEPDTIRPANWKLENHKAFKKIFSWNTLIADNKRYIWLSWPTKIQIEDISAIKKSKFCTLIASNKFSNIKNELYSERRNAIRWFEKNDPNNFDLYGVGWDRIYIAILGRANFILDKIYRKLKNYPKVDIYSSYRGTLKNKREALKEYKFAICYENAICNGWITEKIFDCMMAGVVPVYLGAPDIERLIPGGLYIDRRNFKNYQELNEYLKQISEIEYQSYLYEIKSFLSSDKVAPWTPEYYAKILEHEISN
jgi:hypothetical protein